MMYDRLGHHLSHCHMKQVNPPSHDLPTWSCDLHKHLVTWYPTHHFLKPNPPQLQHQQLKYAACCKLNIIKSWTPPGCVHQPCPQPQLVFHLPKPSISVLLVFELGFTCFRIFSSNPKSFFVHF